MVARVLLNVEADGKSQTSVHNIYTTKIALDFCVGSRMEGGRRETGA